MFDATQHLGLHTCSMLRNIWACTHVRCYATSGLAHMFDAAQHLGLHTWLLLRNTMGWGGVGGGWGGGDDDVLWACTHVGCYGTADVLQGLHTCWMPRNCWCSLGLHTCWMQHARQWQWRWENSRCANLAQATARCFRDLWMLRNLEKERHPFDCDDFIVVLGHMIAVWDATSYTKMMNTWIENMIANNMLTLE